ncbi:MAG: AraC family transcriptional regulator [Bacteroidaceae bacterium]|jgi:transcriptional regulator GlxA family with amidase domain|nr:AraC family transcriptional regulator [Bacteroidaceae bacterium]
MAQAEEIRQLKGTIEQLEKENRQLVNRNLQLSDQLCMWYEFRQRVAWLKEEMQNKQRIQQRADLADDAELLALMELRLERNPSILASDFSSKQLAELLGVSQARLIRLFHHTPIYKSVDDYLFFLRLLRGMQLLREHPEYGIVAVSELAGFNSVRTFQRRMREAIGITAVEFRMLVEKDC